jgi:hypothetical protein
MPYKRCSPEGYIIEVKYYKITSWDCEVCGGKFNKYNEEKHNNTKKHQKALKEIEDEEKKQTQTTIINNFTNCSNITINQK